MSTKTRGRKTKVRSSRKSRRRGTLLIIGGAEDKVGECLILKDFARHARGGPVVIVTAASQVAKDLYRDYVRIFRRLGLRKIRHLYLEQPEEARNPEIVHLFDHATGVFFTGGDQLRITTKMGGTDLLHHILEIYKRGGVVAGTSAGASIMGKTMLVGDDGVESHKVGNWMMAPGLGFAEEMLIDQHFAQRGRIGRLLGAVAMNPGVLGIGIDEDTAIRVEGDHFQVIGRNAVYVVDGRSVSHTNISEASAERTMSMHDVTLHILAEGEEFHIHDRRVLSTSQGSRAR
ncbi:MAG: cyanophycinase [Bdellovibrionales bacterium]